MKEMNNRDTMKAIMITLHNVVLCNFAHKSHLLQYVYNVYVIIFQCEWVFIKIPLNDS